MVAPEPGGGHHEATGISPRFGRWRGGGVAARSARAAALQNRTAQHRGGLFFRRTLHGKAGGTRLATDHGHAASGCILGWLLFRTRACAAQPLNLRLIILNFTAS